MSDPKSGIEVGAQLSRPVRLALILAGLLALPLLFYIGIYAAFVGLDGHDSSVDATEFTARALVLAVPLLLFAMIILSWTCTTPRRLAVLGAVGLALIADAALALYLM